MAQAQANEGNVFTSYSQDPRQFVPPSGQTFTSLRSLCSGKYRNVWKKDDHDKRVQHVITEPKVRGASLSDGGRPAA